MTDADLMRFAADAHLGRLARTLRLLGFDTAYSNAFTKTGLLRLAGEENRIVLSRNPAFATPATVQSFRVVSENYLEQIKTVVRQFGLLSALRPFTRCLVCNGLLHTVAKETIEQGLEENIRRYYQEFWQCESCLRIYWKGSHYRRMCALLNRLQQDVA